MAIHTAPSSCVTWTWSRPLGSALPSGRKGRAPPAEEQRIHVAQELHRDNLVEGGRAGGRRKAQCCAYLRGPSRETQPGRPSSHQLGSHAAEGESRRKRSHERTRASPHVKSTLPPCQCQSQPGPPPVASATPGAHHVPGAREDRTRRRGPIRAIRRFTSTPPTPRSRCFPENLTLTEDFPDLLNYESAGTA